MRFRFETAYPLRMIHSVVAGRHVVRKTSVRDKYSLPCVLDNDNDKRRASCRAVLCSGASAIITINRTKVHRSRHPRAEMAHDYTSLPPQRNFPNETPSETRLVTHIPPISELKLKIRKLRATALIPPRERHLTSRRRLHSRERARSPVKASSCNQPGHSVDAEEVKRNGQEREREGEDVSSRIREVSRVRLVSFRLNTWNSSEYLTA